MFRALWRGNKAGGYFGIRQQKCELGGDEDVNAALVDDVVREWLRQGFQLSGE